MGFSGWLVIAWKYFNNNQFRIDAKDLFYNFVAHFVVGKYLPVGDVSVNIAQTHTERNICIEIVILTNFGKQSSKNNNEKSTNFD